VQDRKGPNRVGPLGLLQPIADGLKFLLKEEVIPGHVDRVFYLMAPTVALFTSLIALAVVPFGPTHTPPDELRTWPQTRDEEGELGPPEKRAELKREHHEKYQFVIAPNLDIGILFVFATGSLAVYAVILGGWSSNNKYSMLGSMRASAQVISYEIPLGASILGVVLLTGSFNLERIIDWQVHNGWGILYHPLAAILFITAVFAECNRLPFDLSECEQELVGGYHTEYSGMKFAMFFLGEYTHMITTSFLVMAVFFGGWHLPFLADAPAVVKLLIFLGKMFAFIFFYMLVRWTIPRFRFDQLMGLAWKTMIPLMLLNVLAVMVVRHFGWSPWVLTPVSLVLLVGAAWVTVLMPKPPQAPARRLATAASRQAVPS
jgi:NADH-quinone oxidoreductase subunit H